MKKRVEIDSGKGGNDLIFLLEQKIKDYQEGVDYFVDETGNFYTIISERLKRDIWPNDCNWYDESLIVVDRQGKIESWRIAADNPREPYKKVKESGIEEIMSSKDKNNSVTVKETQQSANSNLIDNAGSIIRRVKNDNKNWRIELIQGQVWLIHNSAQRLESDLGSLIYNKQGFTNEEWEEIEKIVNNVSGLTNSRQHHLSTRIASQNTEADKSMRSNARTGEIFGIVGVIVAVVIASVLVIKKMLGSC